MEVTRYVLQKNIEARIGLAHLRIALAADLHDRPCEAVVAALRDAQPDMIAIAGDLMCGKGRTVAEPAEQENVLAFLAAAADIAPTFYSVDAIFSGHAHGGQWRFFGQGIFAPGQGWFPKLTSGVHDGRLVISRGLANTVRMPRFFNETELVMVEVE